MLNYHFSLGVGRAEVNRFLATFLEIEDTIKNWLFFLSVKLKDIGGLGDQYEINSPWCYPVVIEHEARVIKRDAELPKFSDLDSIPEYARLPKN